MKMLSRTFALVALLVAFVLPAAMASAQSPYSNGDTPTFTPTGGGGGENPPVEDGEVSGGGATAEPPTLGEPTTVEKPAETPAEEVSGGPTTIETSSGPSGLLPFTGGDVLGLVVIGALLTAAGLLFIKTSRRRVTA